MLDNSSKPTSKPQSRRDKLAERARPMVEQAPSELLQNEAANRAASDESLAYFIAKGMDPERARKLFGPK